MTLTPASPCCMTPPLALFSVSHSGMTSCTFKQGLATEDTIDMREAVERSNGITVRVNKRHVSSAAQ